MPRTEKHDHIVYFRIVVVLFPVLLLLLLEASLRAFDYGDNLALFVSPSPNFSDKPHLLINRRVAQRYFSKNYFVPRPASEGFLRDKPEASYRIFALGGSSMAGWPYPNNVMLTRPLQHWLADTFPEKQIEVINLGIAAINSFTLLDFIDEVLEQQPDAILIYAGHNEFYGALGTASTVSLGKTSSLVRLYLWLQRFKSFIMLRDLINRATRTIQATSTRSGDDERFPTLMGQVIGEHDIPLGSRTYNKGKAQFRENLHALLSKIKAAGVAVIISELVSNVRDHPPFFSDAGGPPSPAARAFGNARRLESEGRLEAARAEYYKAKDLDGLRFRAPEEFNTIIHELAEKHGIPVVPMKSYFEAASPNGIIGNSLMLEHLHPNARGYQLMGRAFFDTMRKHRFLSDAWGVNGSDTGGFEGFSELDVALGKMRILHITDHWPFKPERRSGNAARRYVPQTRAEDLAKDLFLDKISFRDAHLKMAEYHARRGSTELMLREFRALTNAAPLRVENYFGAANILIKLGTLEHAQSFLEAGLRLRGRGPDAASLLQDLTAAYLRTGRLAEARRVFEWLQASAPEYPGIGALAEKLR